MSSNKKQQQQQNKKMEVDPEVPRCDFCQQPGLSLKACAGCARNTATPRARKRAGLITKWRARPRGWRVKVRRKGKRQ
jgi:hypothetical protein